jgi:uncharacterized lipoprotein YehR (DUF1307 family)
MENCTCSAIPAIEADLSCCIDDAVQNFSDDLEGIAPECQVESFDEAILRTIEANKWEISRLEKHKREAERSLKKVRARIGTIYAINASLQNKLEAVTHEPDGTKKFNL